MLVLTRKPGESIVMEDKNNPGKTITMWVLGITGNQIRLGFDAPKETNIARSELLTKPGK